jgi:hypothetical protein
MKGQGMLDIDIGHHYTSLKEDKYPVVRAWLWDTDAVHEAPDFIFQLLGTGQIVDSLDTHLDMFIRSFKVLTVNGSRKIHDGEWLLAYKPESLYILDHKDFAKAYKSVPTPQGEEQWS